MMSTPVAPAATTAETATAPTPEVAARAVGAQKVYGKGDAEVRALDGVDVELGPGRFTATMGPLPTWDRARRPNAEMSQMTEPGARIRSRPTAPGGARTR